MRNPTKRPRPRPWIGRSRGPSGLAGRELLVIRHSGRRRRQPLDPALRARRGGNNRPSPWCLRPGVRLWRRSSDAGPERAGRRRGRDGREKTGKTVHHNYLAMLCNFLAHSGKKSCKGVKACGWVVGCTGFVSGGAATASPATRAGHLQAGPGRTGGRIRRTLPGTRRPSAGRAQGRGRTSLSTSILRPDGPPSRRATSRREPIGKYSLHVEPAGRLSRPAPPESRGRTIVCRMFGERRG
ncbi:hypothetical protein J2853_005478 [Streptosporangium lutulentum]|uniref:Uncharacterized protein n=1 Tax=Streptosporangium lutulentum TaxID=1461250 RepID=A0ABT9QHN1_9ACTN|nr:hypothetical protein [Streptosporangium lutulentum]